jgi:chromosome segregation ATPase
MKPTQEQILSAINKLVRENRITQMSKVSRIDLGLADDVEKLTQQAKDLIPDLTRDLEGIKVSEKNIVQSEKAIVKEKAIAEKADKKERELFRALESAQDKLSTAQRELKGTEESLQRNIKSVDFLNKRLDKTKGKATKTRSSLEKKLNALEKAAKDLGVKIPTGDASKVLKKLISLL